MLNVHATSFPFHVKSSVQISSLNRSISQRSTFGPYAGYDARDPGKADSSVD